MKQLFWIMAVFFISISQVSAQNSIQTNRHFLFFVHGIGGTGHTFGQFPQALTGHLNNIKPEIVHESFVFVYPTADQKMNTEQFAVLLGQYIHKKLAGRLLEGDKISLISHSQGGLVSLIWYFNAYLQHHNVAPEKLSVSGASLHQSVDFNSKYIPYIDAFVTLGTPFWGSKLASLLTDDNWLTKMVAKTFFTKLGNRQLQEMAMSSETNGRFRKNITSIPVNLLNEMRKKIRPLNIAGIADVVEIFREKTNGLSEYLKLFKRLTFGSLYWESDVAVPLPAARFDSIYTVDRNENYVHGQVTGLEKTEKSDFAPLLIINSIHASPNAKLFPDMVEVPTTCVQTKHCQHPSFKYVLDHLLSKPVPEFAPGVPSDYLGGYMVTFRVNFPQGTEAKKQFVDIRLTNSPIVPDYQFVISDSKEAVSQVSFVNPEKPNIYFRTDTGYIKYKDYFSAASKNIRKAGEKVTFLIQAKGFRARYIETIIKPTYTTFIEVNLAPR